MIRDSDIKDLYPENPFFGSKPKFYDKMTYIQKSEVIDEKILVILPCNSGGANQGSYFLAGDYPHRSNNWRKTDIWLRNIRQDIYLAAQSCVEFKYNDGNGALVFEHEMMRVKNHFDYGKPSPDVFTFDSDACGFNMYKMVSDLKKGIGRARDYGIERIVAVMTPLSYKLGFSRAVEDLQMWDTVTLIDSRMGTFDYFMKMINCSIANNFTGILYDDDWSYKFNSKKLSETPSEFHYCNFSSYTNLKSIVDRVRIKSKESEHWLPISKNDVNRNLDQLIEKYRLPYNTPFFNSIEIA